MIATQQEPELHAKLKEVFGYSSFRGNQENIINSLLEGNNTFVIMPTGAGKSLCYQLPALIKEGTAIVISPLIALMKNQVDQLNAYGINACFLNSTLSKGEITRVKNNVLSGEVKLLYVAPESLAKVENLDFLQSANISFIAIDEAHCISEWGHDFRPEYRKIKNVVETLNNPPIIALTATATPKVQNDIQKNLHMEEANIFKSSFNRENLYYEVRPKKGVKKQLIKYIKSKKDKCGIIYCLSRKKVEEIAEFLRVNDIKALPYHAGMDGDVRINNQEAFLNEEVDVIVATIAFGMGIDKPDVRFVIHYDVPKSLEGYYQETGRAGRDSYESDCIMFYNYDDILKLEKFNKDKPVSERENARQLLIEMTAFAESSVCRKRQLLSYFGEYLSKDCGFCDNCLNPREKFEARDYLITALKTIELTGGRFTVNHLTDLIRGVNNEYIRNYSHDKLDVFGKGKNQDKNFWSSVLRQALVYDFLEKDVENIGVLKISEKGRNYLYNPYEIYFSLDHDFSSYDNDENAELREEAAQKKSYDQVLFDLLKNVRKKVAQNKELPPYVVMQESSLEEMATVYPTTKEQLSRIHGVGKGKVEKFGKPFLDTIADYVEENDIITPEDVVVKSNVNKSKTKIYIIQQIDRKISFEEIAEAKDMNVEKVIEEAEHICYAGTRLSIDYYIEQIMDTDKIDEIYDYFMEAETDNIEDAMDELGDDFTEEEIRLIRIKFLSENAN